MTLLLLLFCSLCSSFAVLAVILYWRANAHRSVYKPLPGPHGLPLIGSIHKLASRNPWMSFHDWALQYGTIYQVNLGGTNHVWISDEVVAHDLLAKRGAIYSDRPHIPALIHDNRDSGEYLPLMSQNALWKRQRKFCKHFMNTCHTAAFYGYPELESKRLLKEMLDDPSAYNAHLESFVSRITCRLAWGTSEGSNELKQRAKELLVGVSPTGAIGNKLPFLMGLPDLVNPAKAWERRRMRTEQAWFHTMQEGTRTDIRDGQSSPSWMHDYLSLRPKWQFRDDVEGSYAVGMAGIAGALTIAAPMQAWCLAMCLYPQFLPKLQAEIDSVCGDRPPTYADMTHLPYLRACIRETLRWRPPVPTGIPHLLTQDDIYNDCLIPAGSVVHPLEWSMARNPKRYPRPEMYNPDRWVDSSYPTYQEPRSKYPTICEHSQFGFGRRKCQGQEVTEADMFVGIGALAWAFDLRKAVNPKTGIEISIPECEFSELLIAKPKWFRFNMTVRSEHRRAELLELWKAEDEKGAYVKEKVYWNEKDTPGLGWAKV